MFKNTFQSGFLSILYSLGLVPFRRLTTSPTAAAHYPLSQSSKDAADELDLKAKKYIRRDGANLEMLKDKKLKGQLADREKLYGQSAKAAAKTEKDGQGLLKDEKAIKLAFQRWIEAIDPRHRYGHNLILYYEKWCKSEAGQPLFFWFLEYLNGQE